MNKITLMSLRANAIALLVITLAVLLVACAPAEKGVVVAGEKAALRSVNPGKGELVHVSSVYIAPISVTRGLVVNQGTINKFYSDLTDAFVAESGIDVKSDQKPSVKKADTQTDVTLRTEITRFAKNSSSSLGASRAALFAATFSMIRNSDQKEIWASNYFSTEQPSSVDLIEVTKRLERDRGTQLPSVEALARQAAISAAADFSAKRVEQFIRK